MVISSEFIFKKKYHRAVAKAFKISKGKHETTSPIIQKKKKYAYLQANAQC